MPQSQQGETYPIDLTGVGMPVQNALRGGGDIPDLLGQSMFAEPTVESATGTKTKDKPNWLYVFVAVFILLVIMRFASEHEKAGMETHLLGIGVWNMVSVGLLASVFIVIMKTIGNKYQVPYMRDFFNVV